MSVVVVGPRIIRVALEWSPLMKLRVVLFVSAMIAVIVATGLATAASPS